MITLGYFLDILPPEFLEISPPPLFFDFLGMINVEDVDLAQLGLAWLVSSAQIGLKRIGSDRIVWFEPLHEERTSRWEGGSVAWGVARLVAHDRDHKRRGRSRWRYDGSTTTGGHIVRVGQVGAPANTSIILEHVFGGILRHFWSFRDNFVILRHFWTFSVILGVFWGVFGLGHFGV